MIRFDNITVQFGDKVVLKDFNLEIKKKEKILLSAPSGSGKSSLIKGLLGYIQFKEGEVCFDNEPISPKNIRKIRNKIAYVSQDVELQNVTVSELIKEIFAYKYNKDLVYNEEKIKALLTEFNLGLEIINKKISELSGGERQRIGLIIAILLEREVWILDEVTSGLDAELKEKVVNYVAASDKTVIVISHDNIWQTNDKFRTVRW